MEITREATIDATPEDVWEVIADDDERAAWLGEDGGDRPLRVDEVIPGERVTWTWWAEAGDDGPASTVTITLHPLPSGITTVRVVERVARASTRAVAESWGAWGRRLLSVELRVLFTHVRA